MAALQPPVGGLPSSSLPSQSFAQILRPPGSISTTTSRNAAKPHPLHSSALSFEDAIAGSYKGFPSMTFEDKHVADLSQSFPWTLVGKFSKGFIKSDPKSGRPTVGELEQYFQTLDLQSAFSIGLLNNRHLLIQLASEEDYLRLYSRTIWYVAKVTMRVFKWTPYFNVNRESSLVPVWISLPRLPIIFFAKTALFRIASLLGTPLRLDAATTALKRPGVARLQVEIDLLKPRHHQIWIGMGSVTVVGKEGRKSVATKQHLDYRPIQHPVEYSVPAPGVNQEQVIVPLDVVAGDKASLQSVPEVVVGPATTNLITPAPTAVGVSTSSEVQEPVQQVIQTVLRSIGSEGDQLHPIVASKVQAPIAGDQHPVVMVAEAAVHNPVPLTSIIVVSPSSEDDQSFVIKEANRFSTLENLEDSLPPRSDQIVSQTGPVAAKDMSAVIIQTSEPSSMQNSAKQSVSAMDMSTGLAVPVSVAHSVPFVVGQAPVIHEFNVSSDVDVVEENAQSEVTAQRELVVMLPPIVPISPVIHLPAADTTVGMVSSQVPKPLNVDADSWFPRDSPRPRFSNNVIESSQYCENDSEWEEDTDRDSQEDFLDSQIVRDDIYLQKRKHRRAERERDAVHFRGRGRPLGSRNQTYFDVPRTMSTRSRTLD